MEAKFRREYPFGKERFRGLVVYFKPDGVKVKVVCNSTRNTKLAARNDANELLAKLQNANQERLMA